MLRPSALFIAGMLAIGLSQSPVLLAQAPDADVAEIIHILRDPNQGTDAKGNASLKLIDMGARAKPAIPAVIALLQSPDDSLHDYAVTTLAGLGPIAVEAIPALRRTAASDPSNDIRGLAADAIKKIGAGGNTTNEAPPIAPPVQPSFSPRPQAPSHPSKTPTRPTKKPAIKTAPHRAMPVAKPASHPAIRTVAPPPAHVSVKGFPAWVQPGTRLTYYGASATVAGSGKIWKPDENGDMQSADGQRWSGTDRVGSSGQGFITYDVVGFSGNNALLTINLYLLTPQGNVAFSTQSAQSVGAKSDYWVGPTQLRAYKNQRGGGLTVTHHPYRAGQQTYQGVWVQTATGQSSNLAIYDQQSGVMVHNSSSSQGASSPAFTPGEVANTASTSLAQSTLLTRRSVSYPWARDPVPAWVATVRNLRFQGAITTSVAGGQPIAIGYVMDYSVKQRGSNWLFLQGSSQPTTNTGMPTAPNTWQLFCGNYGFGGLWVPPQGLARLRQGQVLDTDAITHVTTDVAAVTGDGVIIRQVGTGQEFDYGYDRTTGMMTSFHRRDSTMSSEVTQVVTDYQFRLVGKQ